MTNQIEIYNVKALLTREFINDKVSIENLLAEIGNLKSLIFDLDSPEGVKDAKSLKTKSNKFIKEFKEFCDPLEEEGRNIAKIRSEVKLTLERIVDEKLLPISEREEWIKTLKYKLFIPSLDANSNSNKITEMDGYDNYDWMAFRKEATQLIVQHRNFLSKEKIGFDENARLAKEAEEQARIAREEQLRLEGEVRVHAEAQKAIDAADRRADQAKSEAEAEIRREMEARKSLELKKQAEEAAKTANIGHQAKIHNEILKDLSEVFPGTQEEAKALIKAIVNGKIKNLKVTY